MSLGTETDQPGDLSDGSPVGESAGGSDEARRGPLIAPLLAKSIVAAVFAGICTVALLWVLSSGAGPAQVALSVGYLLVLLVLQLYYFGRPGAQLRSRVTYAAMVLQALLAYLPFWQFEAAWLGLPGMLAGTVVLVLPPRAAWPVFVTIVASVAGVTTLLGGTAQDAAYSAVAATIVGLGVYGLTRLASLVIELHAARDELATSAVAHERLRFARDLHDLLGLSLSAIAPKGELILRLLHRDPGRAGRELAEILDVARRALADVRSVARRYRELSLDEESRTVESVLASSGVEVRLALNHGDLPAATRTLLATVLREGVTNVLWHSHASRCEIVTHRVNGTVTLDIVNDGLAELPNDGQPQPGNGIRNLAARAAEAGGELHAGVEADGRFRLHLAVPLASPESPTGETAEERGDRTLRDVARLARVIVVVVFCGTFVHAVMTLLYVTRDTTTIVASVSYLVILLLLQLFYVSRPDTRLRSPMSYAVLAVQVVLVYLPLAQFGAAWTSMRGFLVCTVLLILPSVLAWLGFAAILGSIVWVIIANGGDAYAIGFSTVGTVISGLIVYGLTWMSRTVTELRRARRQLAEVAVANERLRFARDLHDLLGLSLSAITLKCQLVQRLMASDPDRASLEVSEILAIARQALADVRSVASGYRELSLREESQSAESLLAAADVDVRIDLHYGELPTHVGTVLATVLREGVTNVLRHSSGEYCEITVERHDGVVCLDIVNDGVVSMPTLTNGGNGIENLSDRVAMLGGELTAGLDPDGRFRLRATVPA